MKICAKCKKDQENDNIGMVIMHVNNANEIMKKPLDKIVMCCSEMKIND